MALRIYNPKTKRMEVVSDSAKNTSGPTLLSMAASLTEAVVDSARLAKAGHKVRASDETVAQRRAICEGCEHWNPKGYMGLGKCNLCGCSSGKLYLAASQCPEIPPKWGKVKVDSLVKQQQ